MSLSVYLSFSKYTSMAKCHTHTHTQSTNGYLESQIGLAQEKVKEFVTTKPVLQEMLKGLLEEEGGGGGRRIIPQRIKWQ